MNLKKITVVFSLLLFLSAQNAFAKRAPTQPNSYDGAAPTARSMAMGEAGAGLAGFSDSYYYNSAMYGYSREGTKAEVSGVIRRQSGASPSRVAEIDGSGSGLTSFIMIKDTGGLIWQALSNNSIRQNYSGGDYLNTETYINSLAIVAGQKNEKGYSMGINMTYLYGKIGESSIIGGYPHSNVGSGNGFALDLSLAVPAGNNVFFGMDLKNIAGFMFWNDYNTEQLPFIFRAGTGYHFKGFLFATDFEKKFYRFGDLQEEYLRFGFEQYINGAICIRMGFVSDDSFDNDTYQYTYGFGLRIRSYELSAAAHQYKINNENFTKYLLSFSALIQ
ncbi:MAG: hypothetical protein FWH43_08690 [Endomicrobia bacterium]|nr:hypothetical protein [Endomicrobiia bacterium]